VVARPALSELAQREGLAGVEASLDELVGKLGLQARHGPAGERAPSGVRQNGPGART
jgi:hypothetical protein